MLRPDFGPTQRIVVLRNGEVLNGLITETATNTTVETEQGSRLILGTEQVDFVCDSIQDAYWGKSARTRASDLAGQKSLFYWCLKHGLHEQAQNQIVLMTESNAKASDIEFLDRQLNVSLAQLEKRNQRMAKQQLVKTPPLPTQIKPSHSVSLPQTAANQNQNRLPETTPRQQNQIGFDSSIGDSKLVGTDFDYNTFRPLPSLTAPDSSHAPTGLAAANHQPTETPRFAFPQATQRVIQQVGFEEEVEEEVEPRFKTISLDRPMPNPNFRGALDLVGATVTPSNEHEIVTNAQLDRMTRSMPEGTIGPYRSKLERVLINGCSAAKCHDSKSEIMPLMDLGRSKPITRRMSQRNLHETLKYIDRSNPFASPLLAAASKPHAGNEKPILPIGSKHFEQLKLWVIMLSDDPEANYQTYLNPNAANKLPAAPLEVSSIQPANVPEIVPVEPERIGLQPLAPAFKHSQTIGEIPELNKQTDNYQAIDPFDPEIFNRQFGNQ